MSTGRTEAASTPHFIGLPPPRADDVATPELPGTPNSGTTTMSELSTVAIKDGHRGHLQHHHHQPLDAERADRISRLAGLDRVAQPRANLTPSAVGAQTSHPPHGYFDANNQPQILRERSTVGSASATGSVGGRTTWASGSDVYDADKMSEDQEVDNSSMGGFSDEGASLVGFGEGARTPARQQSTIGSPDTGKVTPVPTYMREQAPPSPMSGVSSVATPSNADRGLDSKMVDEMAYGEGAADTNDKNSAAAEPNTERSAETSERLMRERHERDH
ncbi:hypothetical protein EJ08DRAFT_650278 [Tothia fuscella]|uniref:Uncharacterized protein n=1 Tax=Tothia fuscella TaxID=1048955 RepID=A0A9P4NPE2_9PEZI|nr:hypothetical protein EJ08DRAFT_650278 [Tothia fuscella]